MLSFDSQLDQRYDDQVRRMYRSRRHLSLALWWCAVLSVLAVAAAYFLTDHVTALAALAAPGNSLGWLIPFGIAMAGLGSVTAALTAIFKRRAERQAEYRAFASLLAGNRPDSVAECPRTNNEADDAITFMHAWNDFEATAALALHRANADFDRLSPPSVLHALGSNDLLDEVDVHRLRVLIQLRNAIAHGRTTAVPPPARTLLEQVKIRLSEPVGATVDAPGRAQPSPA